MCIRDSASIEQFTAAYMEFIPAYIDWLADEYGAFSLMGKTPAEITAAKTNPVRESHKKKLRKARQFMDASAKCMADAAEQHKSADDVLAALIDPGACLLYTSNLCVPRRHRGDELPPRSGRGRMEAGAVLRVGEANAGDGTAGRCV